MLNEWLYQQMNIKMEKYCGLIQIPLLWYILYRTGGKGKNIEETIIFLDHITECSKLYYTNHLFPKYRVRVIISLCFIKKREFLIQLKMIREMSSTHLWFKSQGSSIYSNKDQFFRRWVIHNILIHVGTTNAISDEK